MPPAADSPGNVREQQQGDLTQHAAEAGEQHHRWNEKDHLDQEEDGRGDQQQSNEQGGVKSGFRRGYRSPRSETGDAVSERGLIASAIHGARGRRRMLSRFHHRPQQDRRGNENVRHALG